MNNDTAIKARFVIKVLFILFFHIGCDNSYRDVVGNKSSEYYKKYNIKLTGKLVSIKDIDSRKCLIKILIDTCNVKEHDLRFSGESYYLYIKNDTAYAIQCCTQSLHLDQRFLIDYSKKSNFFVGSDNKPYSEPLPDFFESYEILQRQYLNGINPLKEK